jgi:hypothetical protein
LFVSIFGLLNDVRIWENQALPIWTKMWYSNWTWIVQDKRRANDERRL